MKIAIDFDDVIAETTKNFCIDYNKSVRNSNNPRAKYDQLFDWNIPSLLGCSRSTVQEIYNNLDYDDVRPVASMSYGLHQLDKDHDLVVVSYNKDYDTIRKYLNTYGFQHIPVYAGVGHKADFYRKHYIDLVIDDNPSYLKGAVTVGADAIRFVRPWNEAMDWSGDKKYTAETWQDVVSLVAKIREKNAIPNAMREFITPRALRGVRTSTLERVFGNDLDTDTVVNENGAKQSRIEGDYTLLPALAVTEVAKVLKEGADKYGVDNWKGLSIDEITNHVYAHLLGYQQSANTEDLSHAACRILMALQLHLEAEDAS